MLEPVYIKINKDFVKVRLGLVQWHLCIFKTKYNKHILYYSFLPIALCSSSHFILK